MTPTSDARGSACWAPHSSLYFEPDGTVRACCATWMSLGRYGPGHQSLNEIWSGADRARHADALDRHDYGLGCQECEVAVDQAQREHSLAAQFDRFRPVEGRSGPRFMDFALSSRCNLQCVMCNGSLSSAIRTQRDGLPLLPPAYDDAFFDELRTFLPNLERAHFKGGEPFLAVENRRVWDMLLELGTRPEVTVTTNGTIWNDTVEHYLRALRMDVIVSVDGTSADTLESIRVGVDHARLWANVDRIAAVTAATGASLTLSFCLMPQSWFELADFLVEVERRGCHGNVVLVNQPAAHDLLRLAPDRLQQVVADLEAEGRRRRAELGSQAGVFDAQVERLRHRAEHPIPLRIGVRRPGPHEAGAVPTSSPAPDDGSTGAVPVDADDLRAELAAWAGREPVAVRIDDAVITEVDAPEWAGWLDSDAWMGRGPVTIADHTSRVLGTPGRHALHFRDDGVMAVEAEWDTAEGPIDVRVLMLPYSEGRPDQELFLASRTDPVVLTAPGA